jgi:hypothetical protein
MLHGGEATATAARCEAVVRAALLMSNAPAHECVRLQKSSRKMQNLSD